MIRKSLEVVINKIDIGDLPMAIQSMGIDILGPFPTTLGQLKLVMVIVDYFRKWIEFELLATIMSNNIQKFIWKFIICRHFIPTYSYAI